MSDCVSDLFVVKMVNVPKERKTYCKGKKCNKHTLHKVTQYKAGKASNFAQVCKMSILRLHSQMACSCALCFLKLNNPLPFLNHCITFVWFIGKAPL